jgi:DNA-directed RNA polymerase subunit beta'
MPLLRGYGRGLDPAEYWAGAYGSRRGVIGTKMITMHAGFAGKQLIQAAHRGVVTEDDCKTSRGIPVRANDPDNVGTVLSVDAGPFKAGQIIDARVMQQLGDVDILVRSPLTCEAGGGVCAHCVGIRESGALPSIGDNVGVAAAQALAERLSQSSLGSKHIAGRMQKGHDEEALTGFKLINQLMQVPKAFQGGAAVATIDGSIKEIKDAPQGGKYIVIGDVEHYVPQGQTVSVKAGARVEEGDILSSGLPNPADLVRHRGIGAGRAAFVDEFRKAFMTSGLTANRRNIELVTRGLINHIEVNDADGIDGGLPGDIMEYNAVERSYTPRHGAQDLSVKDASGKYLEQPYLHYSIGTRITPSVVKTLNKYGINQVSVHNDQPSFTPHMLRAMDISRHDPNWQTRLGGWYLESSLLDALHSDVPSAEHDTSFIPAVAKGTEFGKDLATKGVY